MCSHNGVVLLHSMVLRTSWEGDSTKLTYLELCKNSSYLRGTVIVLEWSIM